MGVKAPVLGGIAMIAANIEMDLNLARPINC